MESSAAPFPRQQAGSPLSPPVVPVTPPYASGYNTTKTVTFEKDIYDGAERKKKEAEEEEANFSTPPRPTATTDPFAIAPSPGTVIMHSAPPGGLHKKCNEDLLIAYPFNSKLLLADIILFLGSTSVLINLVALGDPASSTEGAVAIVLLIGGILCLMTCLWFTQRRKVVFSRVTNEVIVTNRRLLIPYCGDTIMQRVAFRELTSAGCTAGVGVEGILYLESQLGRIDLGARRYDHPADLVNEVNAWQVYLSGLRLRGFILP